MFDVEILASNFGQAMEMAQDAELFGMDVKDMTIWDGIEPPDSYISFGPIRMSRPEYMLFRRANQLGDLQASMLAAALLSNYDTTFTGCNNPKGVAFRRDNPHITESSMLEYLEPVKDTPEGKRAAEVLKNGLTIQQFYVAAVESMLEIIDD